MTLRRELEIRAHETDSGSAKLSQWREAWIVRRKAYSVAQEFLKIGQVYHNLSMVRGGLHEKDTVGTCTHVFEAQERSVDLSTEG